MENNTPYIFKKTEQKALEINLDSAIYGSFAEIGAGQEVARNFFQAGAAAGTIAKTMSAYDKTYSDAIYGLEQSNRYVCESRVYKMLDHEYKLMEERLQSRCETTRFFAFADSVAALNYSRTIKGNGWLGVRFQHEKCSEPSDLVLHVKMLDNDNRLQQDAIGILGVNLIYACFHHLDNPEFLVQSLKDGLENRVSVDFIRGTGPAFDRIDNRLLCLYLVKHNLTTVTIFDQFKNGIHASEFLYKKHLIVVRGNFRPPTLVTEDVIKSSFRQFKNEPDVEAEKAINITELTIDNLTNADGEIDEKDFLDRTELLCTMGNKVIISNCSNHQMLINYLADFKIKKLGLVIGARELLEIIEHKYSQNQDGSLLVAFGELFTRNIKIYVYPALKEDDESLLTARNLPVPKGITFLYKHLLDSHHVVPIEEYNQDLLYIWPKRVYQDIVDGKEPWKKRVPAQLVDKIISEKLFLPKSSDNVDRS